MADRLKGKVAVLTGAAGSIGAATARLFAAEGARVVLADLVAEPLHALAAELGDEVAVAAVTSAPRIAAYATSKHAVIGLMRTAAKEVAEPARCCSSPRTTARTSPATRSPSTAA